MLMRPVANYQYSDKWPCG